LLSGQLQSIHMAPTVVPFEQRHLEAAAGLLAARQARDRAREPLLPAAFERPPAVRPHLERLFLQAGSAGVVALRRDRPVGFLLGGAILPGPRHFMAQFFPPRAMLIPYHGHALASDEDSSLYRDLYAALAEGWVRRGFFEHFVHLADRDTAAREAWDSLGFARELTCALRDVGSPVGNPGRVEVHRAGAEDVDVIEALNEALWQHHVGSPIFAPHLREADEGSRERTLELLADAANPHFVAYRDGQALGMNTFMAPAFLSPLLTPEACTYLLQGIVHGHARGGGVGRALLAHSMDWAQGQGYDWCALHFYASNISGAAFWQANHFQPVEHRLRRRVDERIAWAGT